MAMGKNKGKNKGKGKTLSGFVFQNYLDGKPSRYPVVRNSEQLSNILSEKKKDLKKGKVSTAFDENLLTESHVNFMPDEDSEKYLEYCLTFICGKNNELYKRLLRLKFVHGFTNEMLVKELSKILMRNVSLKEVVDKERLAIDAVRNGIKKAKVEGLPILGGDSY